MTWHWEDGLPSDLNTVLDQGVGNCLGLSLLYLAIAERLELPIRCIRAPQHVFLRWDDGTKRRNIEATAGGIEHEDEWYAKREGRLKIQPDDVESGLFLAPLTTREILAMLLSNLSSSWTESKNIRDESRYEIAIGLADKAIRLNPRFAEAYLNRAGARLARDPGAIDEALPDIETAISIEPTSIPARLAAGRLHGNAERYENALRWFDSALALAPDDAGIIEERLKCLLGLGRLEETAKVASEFLAEHPDHFSIRAQRLRARVRLRDPAWPRDMADLVERRGARVGVHLLVAELLLQAGEKAPAEPAAAMEVLDGIRDDVEGAATDAKASFEGSRLVFKGPEISESRKRRYGELRKAALEALARVGR